MTPAERCANAVSAGKFKSIEAYCAAVVVSADPRVPAELRNWAELTLKDRLGARAWVYLLKARRDAGEQMAECQARAIKQLVDGRILTNDQIGTD